MQTARVVKPITKKWHSKIIGLAMLVTHYVYEPAPKQGLLLLSIITMMEGRHYFGREYNAEIDKSELELATLNGHLIKLKETVCLMEGEGLWINSKGQLSKRNLK